MPSKTFFPFNFAVNAAESDKRDLMKELETIKQLKPHPHVIKLLGCVTESGELGLFNRFCIGNHMISSAI